MAVQVGSGYLDPTRPARVWTRSDPTRRFCQYSGPDTNPTRPAGSSDPGTTLYGRLISTVGLDQKNTPRLSKVNQVNQVNQIAKINQV